MSRSACHREIRSHTYATVELPDFTRQKTPYTLGACLAAASLLSLGLCAIPHSVGAALLINEVAWMGDAESPNNEWIELHNTGAHAVDVDGWVLTDGDTLDIPLSGTVQPGAYAVLERTDENSAPGTAFGLYTGALSNEGRTLTLLRADGSIAEQVAGGQQWESIGGNNETKDTAQRTSAGWASGVPTPGAANTTQVSAPLDSEAAETEQSDLGGVDETEGEPVHVSMTLPDTELQLSVDAPAVAYVNRPVTLTAEASGIGSALIESLDYTWNFGDLTTATGRRVTHTYEHPGEYVVVLFGSYARHSAQVRHEVTVLPVRFSLAMTSAGEIQIQKNMQYEVDLGGFTLTGISEITIPKHTLIRPRGTITVPGDTLTGGRRDIVVMLHDQRGTLRGTHIPEARTEKHGSTHVRIERERTSQPHESKEKKTAVLVTTTPVHANSKSVPPEPLVLALAEFTDRTRVRTPVGQKHSDPHGASVAMADRIKREYLPHLGLIGILVLGIAAVYVRRGVGNDV